MLKQRIKFDFWVTKIQQLKTRFIWHSDLIYSCFFNGYHLLLFQHFVGLFLKASVCNDILITFHTIHHITDIRYIHLYNTLFTIAEAGI